MGKGIANEYEKDLGRRPRTLAFTAVGGNVLGYAAESNVPFDSLQKRLISDGFKREQIRQVYTNPGVSFETRGVSAYLCTMKPSSTTISSSGCGISSRQKKYMETHRKALENAQKNFGVDKEVITAIILVETGWVSTRVIICDQYPFHPFGHGRRRCPSDHLEHLPDDERRMSRDEFEKKADQKSSWAYRELKAFLTYTNKEGLDPIEIKGSYAGALGISQFMPSNIPIHGKDGDADGQINLFVHADAISSIASYLKHYGWAPGISREEAFKVVYHYNHSK